MIFFLCEVTICVPNSFAMLAGFDTLILIVILSVFLPHVDK